MSEGRRRNPVTDKRSKKSKQTDPVLKNNQMDDNNNNDNNTKEDSGPMISENKCCDKELMQPESEEKKDTIDEDNDELMFFENEEAEDSDEELYGKKNKSDYSSGAPPGSYDMFALNSKELQERKARHHEILRKILAEFDLEEVKEKYRGRSMIRDFSHSNRKFRLWLENVMGNDNVKLTDRKWHELFRQKVMEDYEHQLKERERQLAEAEVHRIQRLRLQGILSCDDVEQMNHKNHRRSKKKSPNTYDKWSQRHQHLYNSPNDNIETQMEFIAKGGRTGDRPASSCEKGSHPDDGGDNDDVFVRGGNRQGRGKENDSNVKSKERNKKGDMSCSEEDVTPRNKSKRDAGSISDRTCSSQESEDSPATYSYKCHLGASGLVRQDQHPCVQQLYKEEDLHQLYAQAENLVRPHPTGRK